MAFALSHAAGASSDALEKLLTRKFFEQIQTQRLNEDARQADMRNATDLKQLDATERLRQATLDATIADRTERGADRDAARDLVAEQKFQGRIKLLPTGSRITGQQAVEFGKYGVSPLLEPAVNAVGEPEFKFRGIQDSAEAAARATETQRYHDILAAAERQRAQIQAEVNAGKMDMAAARLQLAQIQTALDQAQAQKPGATKIGYTADQTPFGYRERADGTIEKVDLPPELAGTGRAPLTPAQIEENARAAAAGRAAGTGGGGLGDLWNYVFSPKTPPAATAPAPTTPAVKPRTPSATPKTPQVYDWVDGKIVVRKAK